MNIVVVTGGFDPLHSGHIEYFKAAKQLGDKLVVGLNSDEWLTRKKGQPFMPWQERASIVSAINSVDQVIDFDDADGTAIDAIHKVKKIAGYGNTVIFANGGDRTDKNIPEMTPELLDDVFVDFAFGVGGENKLNSSSWILREWKQPKTLRQWGYYRILHDIKGCKVKELTVEPGKSLSMQKHFKRNEFWLVTEGKCDVNSILDTGYSLPTKTLDEHKSYHIPVGYWHQLSNPYSEPCRIVEIQYGELCVEEDIERKDA